MPSPPCLTVPKQLAAQNQRSKPAPALLAAVALLVPCFASYGNTLGGWFYCDDFSFIQFIHSFRQVGFGILGTMFATPVSEIQPFLSCYRPLPDVIFLIQYLVSGTQPFLFHLTNVVCHWGCAVLVFLIASRLLKDFTNEASLVALVSALSFSAFPLVAEVVCAPTNIVTGSSALSFLAAFWSYVIWKQDGAPRARQVSLLACGLSMLCKELAVILPAVISVYDYCCSSQNSIRAKLTSAAVNTAGFWLILAGYIFVRTLVLGPTVGGYQGSCGEGLAESWAARWLSAWTVTALLPINPETNSHAAQLQHLLMAIYAVLIALGAATLMLQDRLRIGRTSLVLLVWAVLSLTVVAPVWSLEPSLAGGRHLYLVAVPLLIMAAAGTFTTKLKKIWVSVWAALVLVFTFINIKNNDACTDAASQARSLKQAVWKESSKTSDSMVLIGAPYKHHGIYVFPSSNMLRAMFSEPWLPADLNSRIQLLSPWFNMNYDLFSVSRLQLLAESQNHRLLVWNPEHNQLEPFEPNFGDGTLDEPLPPQELRRDTDGTLSVAKFFCDPEQLAQQTGFIEFTLRCKRLAGAPAGTQASVSLWWQTERDMTLSPERSIYLPVIDDGKPHTYRFPVAASMNWLTSHHNGWFEVRLPSPSFHNSLGPVKAVGRRHYIPSVAVINEPVDNDGVVHPSRRNFTIAYDASLVKNAKQLVIEVSYPNSLLERGMAHPWRQQRSSRAAHRILIDTLKGSTQIRPEYFSTPGTYEIEAGTLDSRGQVQYFSDPTFVSWR